MLPPTDNLNRQLTHAIHIAAVIQVGYGTPGGVYYLRKQADGHSRKEAMRALKRRVSTTQPEPLVGYIVDTRIAHGFVGRGGTKLGHRRKAARVERRRTWAFV